MCCLLSTWLLGLNLLFLFTGISCMLVVSYKWENILFAVCSLSSYHFHCHRTFVMRMINKVKWFLVSCVSVIIEWFLYHYWSRIDDIIVILNVFSPIWRVFFTVWAMVSTEFWQWSHRHYPSFQVIGQALGYHVLDLPKWPQNDQHTRPNIHNSLTKI